MHDFSISAGTNDLKPEMRGVVSVKYSWNHQRLVLNTYSLTRQKARQRQIMYSGIKQRVN